MKNPYVRMLAVIVLMAILGAYLYSNKNIYEQKYFTGSFSIENPYKIVTDANKNKYIIDNSKRRVVKLDSQNNVELVINGGEKTPQDFYEANDLAVDDKENIYVLTSIPEDTNNYVEYQRIVKFNSSGNFIKTLYDKKYSLNEQLAEGRLVALRCFGEGLYCALREDMEFSVVSLNEQTGELKKEKSVRYDNSQQNIVELDFTDDFKSIAFVTKNGEVWLQNDNNLELLDSDKEKQELFVPWKIRVTKQGNVYFSDLGSETINVVNPKTQEMKAVLSMTDQIIRSFDHKEGVITAIGDNEIVIAESGSRSVIKNDSLKLGTGMLVKIIAFWVSAAVLLLLIGYLLKLIYIHIFKRNISIVFTQSVVIVIFVALTAAIAINFMYNSFTEKYKADLGNQLKLVGQLAREKIDKEAFARITKRSDYMNDDYKKILGELHDVFNQNKDAWNERFYADLYKIKGNTVYAVVFYDDSIGAYFPYSEDFKSAEFYDSVIEKKISSGTLSDIYGDWLYTAVPLVNENGELLGVLTLGSDINGFTEHNMAMIKSVVLEVATMLVIVVLVLIELTVYGAMRDRRVSMSEAKHNKMLLVRPAAFIFMVGDSMSLPFVPLLMEKLYKPIFNIPKSVVMGLPISAEMLCIAVAAVAGGYMAEKKGWRPSFILGASIISVGAIFSAIAWEPIGLIIARGIAGVGFGLILNSARIFATAEDDEEKRNHTLSYLTAGSYAGMAVGAPMGGMLAERMGYSNVFYVVAFVLVLAAVFAYKMMDNIKPQAQEDTKLSRNKIAYFFKDTNVIVFFLCIYIPISVCIMFLEYFFPVFSEASGVTAADSSRVFMIYGISIIYFGPVLVKLLTKNISSKMATILYAATMVGGLAFFAIQGTVLSAIVAAITIGISESFGSVVAINYFTGLDGTKRLGEGMALGFYQLVEYFGLTIGPMVMGSLILLGYSSGMAILASIVAALTLVFTVLSRKVR